jgi:predicted DNA-binding mobile mystery protein A
LYKYYNQKVVNKEAFMYKHSFTKLKLKQVSESLQRKEIFPAYSIGLHIRYIRDALGMSQRQLAKRLGITQQGINKIENNTGAMTIKTLNKVAQALNLHAMIALVSDRTLESVIKEQAMKKAGALIKRTEATMAMEKQAVSKSSYKKSYDELIADFVNNPAPSLWEDLD